MTGVSASVMWQYPPRNPNRADILPFYNALFARGGRKRRAECLVDRHILRRRRRCRHGGIGFRGDRDEAPEGEGRAVGGRKSRDRGGGRAGDRRGIAAGGGDERQAARR